MNPIKPCRSIAAAALCATLFCAALLGSCREPEEYSEARAFLVTDRSQLIGGPKALGNIGDYILENDKVRILINGHATDMSGGGINRWGGAIMDADVQREEGYFDPSQAGRDALMELVPIFDVKTTGFDNEIVAGPVAQAPQDSIVVLDDGSNGGAARIKVSGTLHDLISLLSLFPAPLSMLPVRAETVYSLEPGAHCVRIDTTYTLLNADGSEPQTIIPIPLRPISGDDNALLSMFSGDAFGDALFYGDSLDVIGPGVFGFSAAWYAQELYDQGRSVFTEQTLLDWSAGVNDDVGYGLVAPDAPLSFPIMEDFLTIAFQQVADDLAFPAPGSQYSYTRYLVIDDGDVAGVLNHVIELKGWDAGLVKGNVFSATDGRAASGAYVLVFEHPRLADGSLAPLDTDFDAANAYLKGLPDDAVDRHRLIPYSRFKTDSGRSDQLADGSFEGWLPVDSVDKRADYLLMAIGPGNTTGPLVPLSLRAREEHEVSLSLPSTGTLEIVVRSQGPAGPHEPCKITILALDGQAGSDPFLGQKFLPGGITAVLHSRDGSASAELPAGSYRVIANRGPEYSADERTVTVAPLETARVRLEIARVVDTSGWIAADLHMHSETSPDSSLTLPKRVLSALVEGLDLVASTDHDYITNYQPALRELEAENELVCLAGEELSQFDYAHFNSYPLHYDQTKTSGGAVQWRDPSPSATLPDGSPLPEYAPQDCFDTLRDRTDRELSGRAAPVIVNHPEESFTGYFRSFGWTQYSATFETPDFLTVGNPVVHDGKLFSRDGSKHFSWDFDGIEVMNGKRWQDIRTATVEDTVADVNPYLPTLVRTADEQRRISNGELLLDDNELGALDDYFTLLAAGKYVFAVGSSDSHSTGSTEAGKCRTYVMSDYDDPSSLDVSQVFDNLMAGRAIATNGPFIQAWVNNRPIGSELHDPDGVVELRIRAQAPAWMALDRLEIYSNGALIGEIGNDSSGEFIGCDTAGRTLAGPEHVVRFDQTLACNVARDTAIVVLAIGYTGMSPYVTPQDGPAIEITDSALLAVNSIIEDLLGIPDLISLNELERNHAIFPFALTNAIFVDVDNYDSDSDGRLYDGPGSLPGWFDREDVPAEIYNNERAQWDVLLARQRALSLSSLIFTMAGE